MTWAKIDDQFHAHRKAKVAWKRHPRALGLHLLAISYCAGQLTDGLVDDEFVEEKIPQARERTAAAAALVEAGLWVREEGGWRINDWLEYNPSRADVLGRRARDAERKARGRGSEPTRSPTGIQMESERNPDGVREESEPPAPAGAGRGGSGDAFLPLEDDARAPLNERVDGIEAILGQCPSLFISRVAIENAVAAYPTADPVRAARTVVTWASDPAFRSTNGAKLLGDALAKQPTKQKTADKDERTRRRLASVAELTGEHRG